MKYVLITDTHFGVRNNSMIWWRSQSDFIYKQLIPHIESMEEDVVLIHLGDVFDSRSSLSTFIMTEVRKMFEDLSAVKNIKNIIVIAGNHDFYSPTSDEWSGMSLVLGNIPKVRLIIKEAMRTDDKILFIPWYVLEKIDLKRANNCKAIFTHADIVLEPYNYKVPVFSGHVHTPYINGNTRNLGSCYPLTFADSNQDRYFYLWDSESDTLTEYANEYSIKFYRVYNEEVLDFDTDNPDDYIELYIKSTLISQPEYLNRIKKLQLKYKNIWLIPQPDIITESVEIESADIETIIKHMLPKECIEKFNYIKEKVNGASG